MKEALTKLIKIDSIVTIIMTLTFCIGCFLVMCCNMQLPEPLVELYKLVVVFYFGNKTGRAAQELMDAVKEDET